MQHSGPVISGDYQRIAVRLGYAGLVPFVIGCVLVVVGHGAVRQIFIEGLLNYGAIILSFMAAVHWGRALFGAQSDAINVSRILILSVVPAVLAWFFLFLETRLALVLLAINFAVLYVYDHRLLAPLPSMRWYLTLRLRLTVIVFVLLCLSAVAL